MTKEFRSVAAERNQKVAFSDATIAHKTLLILNRKGRTLSNMRHERRSIHAHWLHLVGRFHRYRKEPRLLLAELGFIGSRIVGTSAAGNTLLRLSRNYELGPRGTVIEVPRDRIIFESVRQRGSYSPEISQFIAQGLKHGVRGDEKSAVLDIGANCGLVTLQIMNIVRDASIYHLFEPLPRHVHAIRHNLLDGDGTEMLQIHEFALSEKNGIAEFYTEKVNFGNSTFLQNAIMNPSEQIVSEIPTRDTAEFFKDFEPKISRFFLKSDTQGMDALILSRLPQEIWKKVDRATIEILALPDVSPDDVTKLVAEFSQFRRRSWDSDMKSEASLSEIEEFWTSCSGHEKNLFLIK